MAPLRTGLARIRTIMTLVWREHIEAEQREAAASWDAHLVGGGLSVNPTLQARPSGYACGPGPSRQAGTGRLRRLFWF